MDRYIIVFCEGDHDIEFLKRILQVDGFKSYDKKAKDFIAPFDELYINALTKNIKIKDRKFKFQGHNEEVPYSAMTQHNTLIIFHNMGGDGNIEKSSQKIVQKYLQLNDEIIREAKGYDKLDFRFLYFLDADNQGVVQRLKDIENLVEIDTLTHYTIAQIDDYEIGCGVFYNTQSVNHHGKLEDILLELMIPSNETIFHESSSFIEKNQLDDSRQRKYICTDTKEKPDGNIEFKKEKSIISVAGQLQFSGSTNAVIIAKSDYIKKEDILNSTHCQNIIKLFE
ncbi:MAG: hypothetical protein U9N49_01995 [Campylobacterota bacterium]|nr:hypothetical protein [Campylobacterota bacterium]